MDSPTTPRRRLPDPPGASSYAGRQQQLHLEELANPYSSPGSPGRSPQRSPQLNSVSYPRTNSPVVHGSTSPVRGTPTRLTPFQTQRAEWTRLESPTRDHTPIVIDDDDDDEVNDNETVSGTDSIAPSEEFGRRLPQIPQPAFVPSHRYAPSDVTLGSDGFETIDDDESTSRFSYDRQGDDESYVEGEEYDEDDNSDAATLSTDIYEAPSKAQPRRHKSMVRKEVELVRGNLILDCPVPTKLYSFLPRRDNDEFTFMRYTACTSDPDHFASSGFNIRQAIYKREIQLCICVTMYNEDEVLFARTMHSVMKNIAHLCSRHKSRVWGKDGWKKVVVTIVADGRSKIHPRVLDSLAAMGVYQDGIAKNYVNGKEVQAHIFEYTTQVSLDSDLRFQGAEKGIVPVQIIFCLKEKNAKKINSHRWFFNSFCPLLDPNVCILLDVGTKPGKDSLYHLWKAFDSDSNVAGACGEIKAMTGKVGQHLLNPLVAAQNFEYKMSNILDKPMESAFGYISVLPGALSAYRYRALKNHPDGTGPLNSYFKGESLHGADADVFTANMYLAEDRILCWELVAKKGEKWVLKYVRAATGETDVPESIPEFISQRRRWLNGSLFAAFYAQTHIKQIWKTDHSLTRKILLHIEFLYQFANLVVTFFSLANYYLAFYFVAGSLAGGNSAAIPNNGGLYLFLIFNYMLICVIASQFVLSLGNRPQGAHFMFFLTMAILSVCGVYALACGFYFVIKTIMQHDTGVDLGNNVFTNIVVSVVSTYGMYILMSILYLDPWHLLTSSVQYFILLPAYTCTLQIYAFCNTHDVSWGTKGDNDLKMDLGSAVVKSADNKDVVEIEIPGEQLDIDSGYEEALHNIRERKALPPSPPNQQTIREDYYRDIRTRVVLIWLVSNIILALIMVQVFGYGSTNDNVYLKIILWTVATMTAARSLGSMAYLVQQVARFMAESRHKAFSRTRPVLTGQK